MNRVVDGESALRFAVLSGHDVSLGVCLLALDLPCKSWPAFASSAHMELRRAKDGEWFVQVLFYDGLPPEDGRPSASKVLSLSEWRQIVKPLLISNRDDYLRQCRVPSDRKIPPANY